MVDDFCKEFASGQEKYMLGVIPRLWLSSFYSIRAISNVLSIIIRNIFYKHRKFLFLKCVSIRLSKDLPNVENAPWVNSSDSSYIWLLIDKSQILNLMFTSENVGWPVTVKTRQVSEKYKGEAARRQRLYRTKHCLKTSFVKDIQLITKMKNNMKNS